MPRTHKHIAPLSYKAVIGTRLASFFVRTARFVAGGSLRALSFMLGFVLVGSVALAALTTTWGPGLAPQAAPNTGNVLVPWTLGGAGNNMAITDRDVVAITGNGSPTSGAGVEILSQGSAGSFIDFHNNTTPDPAYDWGARIWYNTLGLTLYGKPRPLNNNTTQPDITITPTGNVGIGTATPQSILEVKHADPVIGSIGFDWPLGGGDIWFDGGADSYFPIANKGAATGITDIGWLDSANAYHPTIRAFNDGRVGANQYCDINGANCFTAAQITALLGGAQAPPPSNNTATTCSHNGTTVAQGQTVVDDEFQNDPTTTYSSVWAPTNDHCGMMVTQKRQVTRTCTGGVMALVNQTSWKNDSFELRGATGASLYSTITSQPPSWTTMTLDGGNCKNAIASIPAGTTYAGEVSYCASCSYGYKDISISQTAASLVDHVYPVNNGGNN